MISHDSAADGPCTLIGSYHDQENIPIWRWLDSQITAYPTDRFLAPLKPRRSGGRARVFAGGSLTPGPNGHPDGLSGSVLEVERQSGLTVVPLSGGTNDADALASELFTHRNRGSIVVFPDGSRRSLHVLLRACWHRWVQLGYQIKPLGTGTELRYIVVRKSRHSWYLADWQALTGIPADHDSDPISTLAGGAKPGGNLARTVRLACEGYQHTTRKAFGVVASLTAASTAVNAMCRWIPDDAWLWRPAPGLVAMLRAGGGYRGGHVHYPPYQGPVHKLDIRRAYTWALSHELPVSAAQGQCKHQGVERPGVFLCRVYGPGCHPISLAEWQGPDRGFIRRNWCGSETLAILCSDEFEGIRSLGYVIDPGWGYVWRRTFTLAPFSAACEQLLVDHGERSAIGMVAKRLANAVYGKLAERPVRMETVMAVSRPSRDHLPFLDAAGNEVTDVWARWVTSYRPHQQIGVAAAVTARVRGRVYCAVASLFTAGIRTIAADTDGLLVDADPRGHVGPDSGRAGDWRYEGYSELETVAGPRFFTFRGTVAVAGTSPQPASTVAIAFDRGTVTVEGKVMAPPWQEGAMVRTVTRRLTRGTRASPPSTPQSAPHRQARR